MRELASESDVMQDMLRTPFLEVLPEILAFCSVRAVGRCAAVSGDFRQGAGRNDLWRDLCLRRWRGRQHSTHMRRWLAALNRQPETEDLLTDYACEEHLEGCRAAA